MTHTIREVKVLVMYISNRAAVGVQRRGQGDLGRVVILLVL